MSPFLKISTLLFFLLLLSLLLLRWYSRKPHFSLFLQPLTQLSTNDSIVALTFDDGPSPELSPPLLDLLQRLDVKATFFVNGKPLEAYPQIAKRMLAEGHQLANHTFAHDRMVFWSKAAITKDIIRTDRLLQNLGQTELHLFRPTYGDKFINLPRVIKQLGKQMVTWDVNAVAQYELPYSADKVIRQTVDPIQPGSIIVLHDGMPQPKEAFLKAVEEIILQIKQKGFRFVLVKDGQ